jgi:DNA-binding IclR family transcriptional regulator
MATELGAGSQTLDRALRVLIKVSESGAEGLSLAECTALLGYSKPTTHRIMRTLAGHGLLRNDGERGVYTLGLTTLRLGMDFLEQLDLRREALPLIRELAERTGETVHLGILDGAEVVYIEKVESSHAVRMFSRIGHRMPACSTGLGKAILAFLPREEVETILPERLPRRTPSTITDRAAFVAHLADLRRLGYSTDNIENEEGIRCAGAPVFDHTGAVCAAISIAGPASRVTPERFPELGTLVRDTAQRISARIGYAAEHLHLTGAGSP